MKKILLSLVALFLATTQLFPNGLSLNSIGTRALGMGGSFVGLANDYTAIYWNPAGIGQIKGNYIGIFSTDVIPTGTYKNAGKNIDATTMTHHYISPNAMGYFSFEPAANLTAALGVYVPAGLGAEWKGSDLKNAIFGKEFEWMSKIAVINISPALSYKINDNISVGAALNIFYGMFDMKRPDYQVLPSTPPTVLTAQYSESSNGLGYGVTLGALVKVNDMISVGASFRTQTNVSMSGSATNPLLKLAGAPESSDFDRDVAWPMWIAGGIAVRPIEDWVISFDAQFSQWSKSENEFVTKFKDPKWSAGAIASGKDKFLLHWVDATQIRFGTEYKLSNSVAIRAGFYNDPAPAPDETYNLLFPSISYNAVSLGAGYTIDKLTFDLGFEYLMGKDREIGATNINGAQGTQGMNITSLSLGIGYAL